MGVNTAGKKYWQEAGQAAGEERELGETDQLPSWAKGGTWPSQGSAILSRGAQVWGRMGCSLSLVFGTEVAIERLAADCHVGLVSKWREDFMERHQLRTGNQAGQSCCTGRKL